MNTFECFREYTALKMHFTTSYNYLKYGGKAKNISPISLERHKQRYLFEKLAKMKDPQGFIIANLIAGKVWIGDIVSSEGEQIYKAWRKRIESLDYSLMEEVKRLPDFEQAFRIDPRPRIFSEYIKGNISLETLVGLDYSMGFKAHWDRHMSDDPLWEETSRLIDKYRPFVVSKMEPFRQALKEWYNANRT